MVEVYPFNLGRRDHLLLFGLCLLLELLVAHEGRAIIVVVPGAPALVSLGVFVLNILDHLLDLEIAVIFLKMFGHVLPEFLAVMLHFFGEFEHAFFVAAVGGPVARGVTVLLVAVVLLEAVDFGCEGLDGFVLVPNNFFEVDELLFVGVVEVPRLHVVLALLEYVVDLCDFLLDLVLDALVAYGAEGVQFYFGFPELLEVGVPGVVYLGLGILGAVGGESAHSFPNVAVSQAGFRVSFAAGCLLLLHRFIIIAEQQSFLWKKPTILHLLESPNQQFLQRIDLFLLAQKSPASGHRQEGVLLPCIFSTGSDIYLLSYYNNSSALGRLSIREPNEISFSKRSPHCIREHLALRQHLHGLTQISSPLPLPTIAGLHCADHPAGVRASAVQAGDDQYP